MLNSRTAFLLLALGVAACGNQTSAPGEAPRLEAPAPEAEPARLFTPSNDAARAATGDLALTTNLRLPDTAQAGADALEVLTLRGEKGIVVETQIYSAVSPATQVSQQTLRALLQLPVDEAQVLVYRVSNDDKNSAGSGLCGAEAAAFVVVWEPSRPGEALKILAVSGAAPGAGGARACPLLEYQRR